MVTNPAGWGDPQDEHRRLFAKVRRGEATPEERTRFHELHLAKANQILAAPREELFTVIEVKVAPPKKARIHTSIPCEECGEAAMETRIRRFGERNLCIPCFEKLEAR